MTERLYYTDAYLKDFEATVVDREAGDTVVYLDRTAFYPASGGQPSDLGRLGEIPVVDVVDTGERIAHRLGAPLRSDRVHGVIDWERRFDYMQQHSGQHLLSAVIAELLGHATIGVHFGRESSTLDLDVGAVEHQPVIQVEARANAIVTENRPVRVSFEEAATADGLRRPSERAGTLRIVTIESLDRSACGGTHVRATGEIGPILVRKVERVRKTTRLEFVCGARAVRRAREDFDLLARLAAAHSAAPHELPRLLDQQRAELKHVDAARRELEQQLSRYRARELYGSAPPDPQGRRIVVLRGDEPLDVFRALAQAVGELENAVFLGLASDPPAVVLATSRDSGVDAGAVLREVLQGFGGRGGGSARLAQGSVPDAASAAAVADAIVERLKRAAY